MTETEILLTRQETDNFKGGEHSFPERVKDFDVKRLLNNKKTESIQVFVTLAVKLIKELNIEHLQYLSIYVFR